MASAHGRNRLERFDARFVKSCGGKNGVISRNFASHAGVSLYELAASRSKEHGELSGNTMAI